MLTVFKDNPVLAELDIFVTQPDQQWLLLDSLIAYTQNILKHQPGYIAKLRAAIEAILHQPKSNL